MIENRKQELYYTGWSSEASPRRGLCSCNARMGNTCHIGEGKGGWGRRGVGGWGMLLAEGITNTLPEEDLTIVKPFVRGGETSRYILWCTVGKGKRHWWELRPRRWAASRLQRGPDFIWKLSLSQTSVIPVTASPLLPWSHSIRTIISRFSFNELNVLLKIFLRKT